MNSTALRIAVELLEGKEIADGVLAGQFGTTIVIPISYVVTADNFDEVYQEFKDYPDSFLLSGILSREEVLSQYFGE